MASAKHVSQILLPSTLAAGICLSCIHAHNACWASLPCVCIVPICESPHGPDPYGSEWQTVCMYVYSAVCLSWLCDGVNWANTASISRLSPGRWLGWLWAGLCTATLQTEPQAAHAHTLTNKMHLISLQMVMRSQTIKYLTFNDVSNLVRPILSQKRKQADKQKTKRYPWSLIVTALHAWRCDREVSQSVQHSWFPPAKYYISKLNCWCHIPWWSLLSVIACRFCLLATMSHLILESSPVT